MTNETIFVLTIGLAAVIVIIHLFRRKGKVELKDGILIFLGSSGFFTAIQIWCVLLSSTELGLLRDYKLQMAIGGLAVMWLSVESVVECLKK